MIKLRRDLQSNIRALTHFIYNRERINFDPPYQRGFVWEQWQKDALLDSVINRIPFNAVFVRTFGSIDDTFEIIDGKQRISTLLDFHDRGMIPFSVPVVTYECENWSDEEVEELYKRLNYYGTRHEQKSL